MLKMNRPGNSRKNSILIYTTEDGLTKIDTTFDGDTVWLSIDQMADLFQRDRSVIGKHIRNIFKEGGLQKESVWAKFAYTAADGKTYDVDTEKQKCPRMACYNSPGTDPVHRYLSSCSQHFHPL